MATQALIRRGSLVYDPFVGSGSILIACTHYGGICTGSDIDRALLHGIDGKSMHHAFAQYQLPAPSLLCVDTSHPCFRTDRTWFDAIVCDPPYGMRAGARTSNKRKKGAQESVHVNVVTVALAS